MINTRILPVFAVVAAASLYAEAPARGDATGKTFSDLYRGSQASSQKESQSSQSKDSQTVKKEVRSLNGAKVTVERTKDPTGKETIVLRIPKGNGTDRVKTITEKEYRRLFPNSAPGLQ
jgi:hypothetical protein